MNIIIRIFPGKSESVRILSLCLFLAICSLNTGGLQAATFSQPLNFGASNQSIWGPGGSSAGFNFSDSVSVPLPFGLGSPSVGYSVVANSGSVSARAFGNMTVDYAASLPSPGTTSLNLSYTGTALRQTGCNGFLLGACIFPVFSSGGALATDFGAKAQILGIGPDFTLESSEDFFPQLGTPVSASGSAPSIVQVSVADIGIASAGAQLGLTQTSRFTANAIEGNLLYSLRGSSAVSSTPFSLGSLGIDLDVDLTQPGIWDFWFEDQTLANVFSTAFDLDVGWFAGTIAGCGTFGLSGCDTSGTIASFEVFTSGPFALDFNSINSARFSIGVDGPPSVIPVPAAFWLFGSGLIGLIGIARKQKS